MALSVQPYENSSVAAAELSRLIYIPSHASIYKTLLILPVELNRSIF